MQRAAIAFNCLVFSGFFGSAFPCLADGDVNIYTYRQPELIQPVLDAFTKKTGITANVLYLDTGMIERLRIEGENSPADVIVTVDVARLNDLKTVGATQPLVDSALEKDIPSQFRDPQGHWFGLTLDARVIYASSQRVKQTALTYEDLAKPLWKGKVCLRDGRHSSNLGLFAEMIAVHGADDTEKWLSGVKANLASRPSGSDLSQIQAIAEGRCDVALGNATVLAAMLADDAQPGDKAISRAVRMILPNTQERGTYANISGMALARHAPNRDNGVQLMEFFASRESQELYAKQTLEYPIAEGAAPAQIVQRFGMLKTDGVPMNDVLKYRDQAGALVDQTGFNNGPGN